MRNLTKSTCIEGNGGMDSGKVTWASETCLDSEEVERWHRTKQSQNRKLRKHETAEETSVLPPSLLPTNQPTNNLLTLIAESSSTSTEMSITQYAPTLTLLPRLANEHTIHQSVS